MADTPQRIGKYKIISQLAAGGMGAVYKAQHPTLDQQLVIKRLTMQDSGHIRERFRREAQIMFSFKSDYIVDVYDHFRDSSAYHIVQEYIDGISLEDLIERERYLPEHIALRIFLYAARALKYAHSRKVVHRDIKPGNILISKQGEVKLVDFGIASIRDQPNDEDLTQVGMTLGTPSYMAPEQFTSSRDVDKRADIYSLGVMLYEMLTGKKPFPGTKLPETYQRIVKGKYLHPRRHNPNISRFAIRMIRKCMRPKIRRRYQDLSRVIRVLEKQLRIRPVIGVPFEAAEMLAGFVAGARAVPPRRRLRVGRLAVAALLLAAATTVGIAVYQVGGYYRILDPHGRGRVELELHSDAAESVLQELPRQAVLYSQRSDSHYELPLQEPLRSHDWLQLLPEGLRPQPHEAALVSRGYYIPSGQYLLDVRVGTRVYRESVYVQPWKRQFSPTVGEDRNRLRVQHFLPDPLPLRIDMAVKDQLAGHDITGVSVIQILHQDHYISLQQAVEDGLLQSGDSLDLRISRPGYYSQEMRVETRTDEPDVQVNAALVPRAGSLELAGNDARIRWRLNGSTSYTAGGMQPHSRRMPRPEPDSPAELELPPGRYTLEARRGAGAADEVGLLVESDQRYTIEAYYDADEDELRIITEKGDEL